MRCTGESSATGATQRAPKQSDPIQAEHLHPETPVGARQHAHVHAAANVNGQHSAVGPLLDTTYVKVCRGCNTMSPAYAVLCYVCGTGVTDLPPVTRGMPAAHGEPPQHGSKFECVTPTTARSHGQAQWNGADLPHVVAFGVFPGVARVSPATSTAPAQAAAFSEFNMPPCMSADLYRTAMNPGGGAGTASPAIPGSVPPENIPALGQ